MSLSMCFTIRHGKHLGETLKFPRLSRVSEAATFRLDLGDMGLGSRLGLGSEGLVHIPVAATDTDAVCVTMVLYWLLSLYMAPIRTANWTWVGRPTVIWCQINLGDCRTEISHAIISFGPCMVFTRSSKHRAGSVSRPWLRWYMNLMTLNASVINQ